MLDARGFVAETNATHVFIVDRRRGATTPRTVACPEGITRATVLELCRANAIPCDERDLSLTEVYRADEVFCTGTMGELAAVTRVDGRTIGDGKPGPMTGRLLELFRELVAREGTAIVASRARTCAEGGYRSRRFAFCLRCSVARAARRGDPP